MALIKILMIQGSAWMEMHVPHTGVLDQLSWLKEYIQPHAIKFPGGIWDELNGWREKTLTSEYYNKFVKKNDVLNWRELMEQTLYSRQSNLFTEMMRADQWNMAQQDLIRQRVPQWGSMGLMRLPLNQLGAFMHSTGA